MWTLPSNQPVAAQTASGQQTGQQTGSQSTAATAWHSGAGGEGVADGSFGSWRGTQVQAAGTWNDTTPEVQSAQGTLNSEYANFNGDLDVAVGGLNSKGGETWDQAAQGAFTNRWTQAVQKIKAARQGKPGITYVRFAHEMNGNWYGWKVTPDNVDAFKKSWRTFHDILKQEFPEAQLVFGANSGTSDGNASIKQMWPGDDVVDVVGVDFYDGWPRFGDSGTWQQHLNDTGSDGSPRGIGAWQSFAKEHGKPLSFPEWGLNPAAQNTDNPTYIKEMHDFMAANAATPGGDNAGKVVYDLYYQMENDGFKINSSQNNQAGDLYRSLNWGGQGQSTASPQPTPGGTGSPQPTGASQPGTVQPGTVQSGDPQGSPASPTGQAGQTMAPLQAPQPSSGPATVAQGGVAPVVPGAIAVPGQATTVPATVAAPNVPPAPATAVGQPTAVGTPAPVIAPPPTTSRTTTATSTAKATPPHVTSSGS